MLAIGSSVLGQKIAFEPVRSVIPSSKFSENFIDVNSSCVRFFDANGDDNEDVIVIGNNDGNYVVKLYFNDGWGNFNEASNNMTGVYGGSIDLADVDSDDDIDIIISGRKEGGGPLLKLYLNNGIGQFSSSGNFNNISGTAIFGDVDGDADIDLYVTGSNSSGFSKACLYLNNGSGSFNEVFGVNFLGLSSAVFIDVENDGDIDILAMGNKTNNQTVTKLYINDGNGVYSDANQTVIEGLYLGTIDVADIDGDNDQDVLITGSSGLNPQAKVYKNNGQGVFSLFSNPNLMGLVYSSTEFADIDGDNDLDVLITGSKASNDTRHTNLYRNNGNGFFSKISTPNLEGVFTGASAFADLDKDGDQDLLITGFNNDEKRVSNLYENDGSGKFLNEIKSTFPSLDNQTPSQTFLDKDNDGDSDLLIVGLDNQNVPKQYMYENDGNGVYSISQSIEFMVWGTLVEAIDVDGDKDIDLVMYGERIEELFSGKVYAAIYLNDGAGTFSFEKINYITNLISYNAYLEDVDNDGDTDILIAGRESDNSSHVKLFVNDGFWNFTAIANNPFLGYLNGDVTFFDANGNGYKDVLVSGYNWGDSVIFYKNIGGTFFLDTTNDLIINKPVETSAASDVNGDGYIDLFLVESEVPKIYLNKGDYLFVEDSINVFHKVYNSCVKFFDADNDGDDDLIVCGTYDNTKTTRLYENDGTGVFILVEGTDFYGISSTANILTTDVDGDEDIDVLLSGNITWDEEVIKLYKNLTRTNTSIASDKLGNSINIFPNPTKEKLNIMFDIEGEYNLMIYDLQGKEMYQKNAVSNTKTIDVSGLIPGIYIVKAKGKEQVKCERFIKL